MRTSGFARGLPVATPLGRWSRPEPERLDDNKLAGKIRVHELAKELGLTNKETLDLSLGLGIGVKTHSSSIEEAQADRVRRKAQREGLIREVQPEEPKTEKKAAKAAKARQPRQPRRKAT